MIKSCITRGMSVFCLVFVFLWVSVGTVDAVEIPQKRKIVQKKVRPPVRLQESIPGFKKLNQLELRKKAAPLGLKPTEVIKGDHVASGVALRNRGGGVINLRGVPAKVNIYKAYLYWCFLADDLPDCMGVSINGVEVKGKLVGKGNGPCWGTTYNFVYRASVPQYLLYEGGNGDYKISGVPSSQGFGMDPWKNTRKPFLAEGATLILFFTRVSGGKPVAYPVTYLYESTVSGAMFISNFSAVLSGFNAGKSSAKLTMIGADGQKGKGNTSSFYVSRETSFFQGTQFAGIPASSSTPSSANHDADSDWNGSDGGPLNQLWDTRTHVIPIKYGSTSAKVEYQSYGDCLVICAFLLTI